MNKYRAWLRNEKKMVEVTDIHYRGKDIIIEVPFDGGLYGETKSYTVGRDCDLMQSTGYKTLTLSKEVYDGDILSAGGNLAMNKWVVKFTDNGWMAEPQGDCKVKDRWVNLALLTTEPYEIVGNIHANPELIGGGK